MGATGQRTLRGVALPKHWRSQSTQELCTGTGDPMQAHEILTYTGEVWPQGFGASWWLTYSHVGALPLWRESFPPVLLNHEIMISLMI